MNIQKLLIVFATILLVPLTRAQSVNTVYQSLLHNSWGHVIHPMSFTFKANLDLGGLSSVVRTVERSPWNSAEWEPILLQTFYSNTIDQFDVPFPYEGIAWDIRVTYAGDGWTRTIEVNDINVEPVAEIIITDIYVNGFYLYVTTTATRYNSTEIEYQADEEIQIYSSGNYVATLEHSIPSAGMPTETHTFSYFLAEVPAGELCVTGRLLYSHHSPAGFSDFSNVLLATTNGSHCTSEWQGIPTGIEPQITLSSEAIMVSGIGEMRILDMTGKLVVQGSVGDEFNTTNWPSGVYIASIVQDGHTYNKKFSITH